MPKSLVRFSFAFGVNVFIVDPLCGAVFKNVFKEFLDSTATRLALNVPSAVALNKNLLEVFRKSLLGFVCFALFFSASSLLKYDL